MKKSEEDVVMVRRFSSVAEANVIHTLLKDHDIECELINTNLAQLFPGNPAYSLQIELIARREDLDKIKEILSSKFKG